MTYLTRNELSIIVMETELGSNIIRELKEVVTVDVMMDNNASGGTGVIVIDTMKMQEIMCGYDYLRTIVQRMWSNLPSLPVPKKTHVIVWLIVCKDYSINHSTIKWPGPTPTCSCTCGRSWTGSRCCSRTWMPAGLWA